MTSKDLPRVRRLKKITKAGFEMAHNCDLVKMRVTLGTLEGDPEEMTNEDL